MPAARVNGISVDYSIEGEGEPLLLIMGLGLDKSGWKSQVSEFRKYFKVVTFDNRGVGNSDKPQGPYSTRMMADDAAGLLDYLKMPKAHVLGASMGGMIAQEVALNYPDRVTKLVLACTYCQRGQETSGETPEFASAVELQTKGKVGPLVKLLFEKWFYRIAYLAMIKIQSMRKGETEASGFMAQVQACMAHDTVQRLPTIKAPTLVIVGTGDRVIKPSSSDLIAKRIPNAKLVKIQNGSHLFSFERRKEFNREILSFLKSG